MIYLAEKLDRIRAFVFGYEGRLLERQLFRFLFEDAGPDPVLAALAAYQNPDGGFGNGIEPDLMAPQSSGIGLETALDQYHLIGSIPEDVAAAVIKWLERSVNARGIIEHPPSRAEQYPLQPWWRGNDDTRVFAVIAALQGLGVAIPDSLKKRVDAHAVTTAPPDELQEYDYPIYVYAMRSKGFVRRDEFLGDFTNRFPDLSRRLPDRFLVLSRYWSPMSELIDRQLIEDEANRMWASVDEEGRIPTGYPDLPWWDRIMLLDALAFVMQQQIFS